MNINKGLCQGLCDNSNFEKGDFVLPSDKLCLPSLLTLTDNSGGADVKYLFNYTTESFEEARVNSQSSPTYDYNTLATTTRKFTIVQTGYKNNKPMVACKDIWVRKGNQPVFSYHYCSFLTLNLTIPNLPINDFDSYVFSVPTTGFTVNITKADLPFSNNYPIPPVFNAYFRINGVYTDITKNCSTGLIDVNIPNVNFVTGTALPYYPNINFIELTSAENARLGYTGPFTKSTNVDEQYNLYMFPKNSPISLSSPVHTNISSGVYNVLIPDSTKSYCFMVQKRKDHCNNSSPERSSVICTQPLLSLNFSPIQNVVSLDPYPFNFLQSSIPGVSFSPFLKTLSRTTAGENPKRQLIPLSSNNPLDNTIDCKKNNCYRTEIESKGRVFTTSPPVLFSGKSISNQRCFDASKEKPDPLSDIWVSTENFRNIIRFNKNTSWSIPISKVFLQKFENNNYKIIDSVSVASGKLIDKDSVLRSENYQIFFRDNCDAISLPSDSVNNIFLKTRNSNELFWTQESPYSLVDINKYKIYYLDENIVLPVDSTDQAANLKTFVADLSRYIFKAKMKVASVSLESNPRYSFSNNVEIPIKQTLSLAQVFTPNQDGNNDAFEVFKNNPNALDIILEIFDRSGNKISEINKNFKDWDGTYNGKPLPVGTYVYSAKAVFPNNEIIYKKGLIEIIK